MPFGRHTRFAAALLIATGAADAGVLQAADRPTPVPPWGTAIGPPDVAAVQCAVPGLAHGRNFYVDPIKGSSDGDGSQSHPWHTLSEVMARPALTTAQFTEGDTINLLSGDHGDVVITSRNLGFVSVRAAPGEQPRLRSLKIGGASKWIFDQITVQGLRNGYSALVTILPAESVAVDNIILTNSRIMSTDNSSNWTQVDWQKLASFYGIRTDSGGDPNGANCITISHNLITNVLFAVGLATSNSRFTDNIIDNFGGDGLNVAASHVVIARNLITNNVEGGYGNHNDAIQLNAGRFRSYREIIIDRNTVIRQTRADVSFTSVVQGISAFNSDWFNVTVTNNVVIVNAPHGIAFGSVHGGLFTNNIVLNDEKKSPNFGDTWLRIIGHTHEGFGSGDVVLRNNVSWDLGTDALSPTIKFESNITTLAAIPVAGRVVWVKPTANIPGGNRVIANIKPLFVDYEPLKFRFDLRPVKSDDARNWPNRLMAIVGGPSDGLQPGPGGATN